MKTLFALAIFIVVVGFMLLLPGVTDRLYLLSSKASIDQDSK